MAIFSGYHTIAILEMRGGITLSTYLNLEELVKSAVYRLCSEQKGGTKIVETLLADITAHVNKN